jgi:hypothetical protein
VKILGMHIYGTSDPDNPRPVAVGGIRGERDDLSTTSKTYRKTKKVDGRKLVIEEVSGASVGDVRASVSKS